jgi:hypothetical protein
MTTLRKITYPATHIHHGRAISLEGVFQTIRKVGMNPMMIATWTTILAYAADENFQTATATKPTMRAQTSAPLNLMNLPPKSARVKVPMQRKTFVLGMTFFQKSLEAVR